MGFHVGFSRKSEIESAIVRSGVLNLNSINFDVLITTHGFWCYVMAG